MHPSYRLRAATALAALSLTALAAIPGATSSVASSTPNCGGEVATNPNGTAMTCTFDDEFSAATGDATALDTTKWIPQLTAMSAYTTGPSGSKACYVNTPNNISVANGVLSLTAQREAKTFSCKTLSGFPFTTRYTAGMVSTYQLFTQTYGRFEVSAELPSATIKGLQETLWLYPSNAKYYGASPASGEIDFAEFYSQYSTLDVPYIHYNYTKSTVNAKTNTNIVTAYNCTINRGQFNDYVALWQPGTITLQVNGKTCLTDNYIPNKGLTSPQPFDQPFFIALTQALGIGTNTFTASTPLPATTHVDYVRVWK
jgi:beta-glucanase (GH16 family)